MRYLPTRQHEADTRRRALTGRPVCQHRDTECQVSCHSPRAYWPVGSGREALETGRRRRVLGSVHGQSGGERGGVVVLHGDPLGAAAGELDGRGDGGLGDHASGEGGGEAGCGGDVESGGDEVVFGAGGGCGDGFLGAAGGFGGACHVAEVGAGGAGVGVHVVPPRWCI